MQSAVPLVLPDDLLDDTSPSGVETRMLLATLGLLMHQRGTVLRVREDIDVGWIETNRSLCMDFDLSPFIRAFGADSDTVHRVWVPIATPAKREVYKFVSATTPGGSVRLLGHTEHQAVATKMFAALLGLAIGRDAAERAINDTNVWSTVATLVTGDVAEAATAATTLLNETDGLIWVAAGVSRASVDPKLLPSLTSLAEMLARSYIVLAEIYLSVPGECSLSWTYSEPSHRKDSDAAHKPSTTTRQRFGDEHPTNVTVKLPKANQTDHYNVTVLAGPGFYVRNAEIRVPPAGPEAEWTSDATRAFHGYIGSGTETKTNAPAHVLIKWAEVPFGSSIGPAVASCFLAVTALLATWARSHGFIAASANAYVGVALVSILTPTLAFARRSDLPMNLEARIYVLLLSLFGLLFGAWWTAPLAGHAVAAFPQSPLYTTFGLGLLFVIGCLACVTVWRLIETERRFQAAAGTGRVSNGAVEGGQHA